MVGLLMGLGKILRGKELKKRKSAKKKWEVRGLDKSNRWIWTYDFSLLDQTFFPLLDLWTMYFNYFTIHPCALNKLFCIFILY